MWAGSGMSELHHHRLDERFSRELNHVECWSFTEIKWTIPDVRQTLLATWSANLSLPWTLHGWFIRPTFFTIRSSRLRPASFEPIFGKSLTTSSTWALQDSMRLTSHSEIFRQETREVHRDCEAELLRWLDEGGSWDAVRVGCMWQWYQFGMFPGEWCVFVGRDRCREERLWWVFCVDANLVSWWKFCSLKGKCSPGLDATRRAIACCNCRFRLRSPYW